MDKTILITGATSGIGKACAEKFAQAGCRLILTGRRKELLHELRKELMEKYHVDIFAVHCDIRHLEEVNMHLKNLPETWQNINVLINNAGLAVGLNTIQNGIIDDWERMIDTNLKGLLYVSQAIIPFMIKKGSGHIINIGSIAGKEAYINGNVYGATKAAVDMLTKGMRMDLVPHGIKVTQVAPGAVETEFSIVRFKGDKERAGQVYKGFEPLHGEDVADVIYYCASLPGHVNINDLVLMPTAQASASVFHKEI